MHRIYLQLQCKSRIFLIEKCSYVPNTAQLTWTAIGEVMKCDFFVGFMCHFEFHKLASRTVLWVGIMLYTTVCGFVMFVQCNSVSGEWTGCGLIHLGSGSTVTWWCSCIHLVQHNICDLIARLHCLHESGVWRNAYGHTLSVFRVPYMYAHKLNAISQTNNLRNGRQINTIIHRRPAYRTLFIMYVDAGAIYNTFLHIPAMWNTSIVSILHTLHTKEPLHNCSIQFSKIVDSKQQHQQMRTLFCLERARAQSHEN